MFGLLGAHLHLMPIWTWYYHTRHWLGQYNSMCNNLRECVFLSVFYKAFVAMWRIAWDLGAPRLCQLSLLPHTRHLENREPWHTAAALDASSPGQTSTRCCPAGSCVSPAFTEIHRHVSTPERCVRALAPRSAACPPLCRLRQGRRREGGLGGADTADLGNSSELTRQLLSGLHDTHWIDATWVTLRWSVSLYTPYAVYLQCSFVFPGQRQCMWTLPSTTGKRPCLCPWLSRWSGRLAMQCSPPSPSSLSTCNRVTLALTYRSQRW